VKNKIHDVLVLNRGYLPIHIIEWKRAISLIYQENARALDADLVSYSFDEWLSFSGSPSSSEYTKVSSTSMIVSVPEIITLTRYNRLPQRDVKYSRQSLFERDGFRCAYCGENFPREKLTVDHVIPRVLGGKTSFDNTVTACKDCNARKGGRTPEQAKMPLLYRPKRPRWISPIHKKGFRKTLKSWRKFMFKEPDVV